MQAKVSRPGWRVLFHPALSFAFTAIVSHLLYVGSSPQLRLADWLGDSRWLWLILLVVLPGLGLMLMVSGRRFWAWPYAILAALWLVPAAPKDDLIERGAMLINAVLIMLLLALLETVGLSIGRWLDRRLGVAYFLLLATALFVLAVLATDRLSFNWLSLFALIAGVLAINQAGLQYRKWQASRNELSQAEPVTLQPAVNQVDPGHLPWTVTVDSLEDDRADSVKSTSQTGPQPPDSG